jgi:hypothetical protein
MEAIYGPKTNPILIVKLLIATHRARLPEKEGKRCIQFDKKYS